MLGGVSLSRVFEVGYSACEAVSFGVGSREFKLGVLTACAKRDVCVEVVCGRPLCSSSRSSDWIVVFNPHLSPGGRPEGLSLRVCAKMTLQHPCSSISCLFFCVSGVWRLLVLLCGFVLAASWLRCSLTRRMGVCNASQEVLVSEASRGSFGCRAMPEEGYGRQGDVCAAWVCGDFV